MIIKEINAADTWELRHQVMWPDKPLDFIKLKDDEQGTHYGVFENQQLVSVVSCFEQQGQMQFRKLATLADKQQQGFASALLFFIIQQAKEKGLNRIWCNARVNKKSFYEKFGLSDTGQGFLKAGKEYTLMELRLPTPTGI